MDDDLDYYLAMEEDAQQEQEEWDEDVDMDVQQQTAPAAPTLTSINNVQPATEVQRAAPFVSNTAVRSTLSAPVAPAPTTSVPKFQLSHLPTTSTATASKKLNPKEFALKMSAERRLAMGEIDELNEQTNGRKAIQIDAESELHTTKALYTVCAAADKFVHDRPPALQTDTSTTTTGSVPCVLADGTRVYLYKRKVNLYDTNTNASTGTGTSSGTSSGSAMGSPVPKSGGANITSPLASKTLLSKSMTALIAEADALKAKQLLNRDKVLAEKAAIAERSVFDSVMLDNAESSAEDGSLWVDKYAPHSFTQLLSPEKINREVLKAVKKWDKYVFKTGGEEDAAAANGADADDCRPKNKVILLCGPPGTGKTTLAHIVAKHCGYHAIEVNASDDRSPEKLRDTIYNATQNTTLLSTMGSGDGQLHTTNTTALTTHTSTNASNTISNAHKPNLIILDEIDGIDGSRNALDVLTAIIKQPLHHSTTKKKGSNVFALTRPLICICNDQYAPALRDLVRLAEVFVFSAPKDVRLIARLRQVCKSENLNITNSNFISELCSATGYDIRASINNLQFAALKSSQEKHNDGTDTTTTGREGNWGSQFGSPKNSNSTNTGGTGNNGADKSLDIGAVLHSMIKSGLKDDTLDLSHIWKQMFTSGASTGGTVANAGEEEGVPKTKVDHSMRAMDSMLSYGDHSVVIGGIYENMHSMESLDPSMNKRTILADWLSYAEQLLSYMPKARDGFQLMPYVAAMAGVVYTHCAVAARRVQVAWPRRDKEMHFKGVQKANILQSVCDNSSIHSLLASKQRIVLDFLPFLLDIITPPPAVRPLPFITLPAPEQHAITDTIRVMESCGVSYALSKVIEAEPKYHNNSSNKFNHNATPYSNTTTSGSSKFTPYNSHNHNGDLILKLDPAFDELLAYPECEELVNRHVPVVAEMRQVLYTEQRKYSIQLKARKLDGDTFKPTTTTSSTTTNNTTTTTNTTTNASNKLDTESTPYLIMQQQQRDSKATKRQHSGALEGFFTKTAGPSSKKLKAADTATSTSSNSTANTDGASASGAVEKKVFNVNAIRFKFNQGFSNAVKRSVLMDEFL